MEDAPGVMTPTRDSRIQKTPDASEAAANYLSSSEDDVSVILNVIYWLLDGVKTADITPHHLELEVHVQLRSLKTLYWREFPRLTICGFSL